MWRLMSSYHFHFVPPLSERCDEARLPERGVVLRNIVVEATKPFLDVVVRRELLGWLYARFVYC